MSSPSRSRRCSSTVEGTEPHYQIIVERENHADKVTVLVEVIESIFFDEMKKQRALIETHQERLAAELGIGVEVKLVEEKTLERFEGKGRGSSISGNSNKNRNSQTCLRQILKGKSH